MEADIAAIRQSVAVIEWCCTVLVYAGIPAIGVYLFRLVVLARERMARNKVIALFAALLVGNQAYAVCDYFEQAVGGTICYEGPGECGMPPPGGDKEFTCLSATSAEVTLPAECLTGHGLYRRIVITLKAHVIAHGADTSLDVDWKVVVFIANQPGPIPSEATGGAFYRLHNAAAGTDWIMGPGPPLDSCETCENMCTVCIFASLIEHYRLGSGRFWPRGTTPAEQWALIYSDPVKPCAALKDTDGDGIPDIFDEDDDGDGIPDDEDPDDDGDGIPDHQDPDKDDDGDGIPNPQDPDDDDDGTPDNQDPDHPENNPVQGGPGDGDGDGIPDWQDPDDDNDGIPDAQDPDHPRNPNGDPDNDGIPNGQDPDDDNDGIPDNQDPDHPAHPDNPIGDPDDDGIPNIEDPDDDNDGTPDDEDDCPAGGDCDGDPDNNPDPGDGGTCSSMTFTKAFTLMIMKSLGFDGAMLEEEAAAWEDAGGLGLRVPYWNPISYQSGNWSPSYILVSPAGKVSGPDFDEVTIPYWEETAAIVKTGLSALLIIWFAGAMFRLVTGAGGDE